MVSKKVANILEKVEQTIRQKGTNPGKKKWRYMVAEEAENHIFDLREIRELLRSMQIDFMSPPLFANDWIPSLCKKFMSLKYTNPYEKREFVVMVSSNSIFGVSGIIHHTTEGYKDPSWFKTFVNDLDIYHDAYQNSLKKILPAIQGKVLESTMRKEFSKNINDPINKAFALSGMKKEQVYALNAFYQKYIPDIEGICSICFKLSLPKSGPGIRWFSEDLNQCELRITEPKVFGQEGQKKVYLTHRYKFDENELWVKWDGISIPLLDQEKKQLYTHLCWETYDYDTITKKLTDKVPICKCQKFK